MIEVGGGKMNSTSGWEWKVGGDVFFLFRKVKDYSTARDDVHDPHASFIVQFSLKLDLFFLAELEHGRTLL